MMLFSVISHFVLVATVFSSPGQQWGHSSQQLACHKDSHWLLESPHLTPLLLCQNLMAITYDTRIMYICTILHVHVRPETPVWLVWKFDKCRANIENMSHTFSHSNAKLHTKIHSWSSEVGHVHTVPEFKVRMHLQMYINPSTHREHIELFLL